MTSFKRGARRWSKEAVDSEAKQYSSRKEFSRSSEGAYRAALRNGWMDEVCSHMPQGRPATHWDKGMVFDEAKKHDTRKAFYKNGRGAYQFAYRHGWLDEVCAHMPPPRSPRRWTKERLIEEAALYSTRAEFRENSHNAYRVARGRGWLDELCAHMPPDKQIKWTLSAVAAEAAKYFKRGDFRKSSEGAYRAALRNDWINEVCAHMGS